MNKIKKFLYKLYYKLMKYTGQIKFIPLTRNKNCQIYWNNSNGKIKETDEDNYCAIYSHIFTPKNIYRFPYSSYSMSSNTKDSRLLHCHPSEYILYEGAKMIRWDTHTQFSGSATPGATVSKIGSGRGSYARLYSRGHVYGSPAFAHAISFLAFRFNRDFLLGKKIKIYWGGNLKCTPYGYDYMWDNWVYIKLSKFGYPNASSTTLFTIPDDYGSGNHYNYTFGPKKDIILVDSIDPSITEPWIIVETWVWNSHYYTGSYLQEATANIFDFYIIDPSTEEKLYHFTLQAGQPRTNKIWI